MLLLFDVDGTLLSGAANAHRDALYAALRVVHGVDASRASSPLDPAGRTDGEIARILLLDAGVSAQRIDELGARVREEACDSYARLCPPDLSDRVVPGIRELLGWLSQRDDVRLGLVTGNYQPIARLKLARAGIGAAFTPGLGGFGSDSEDRAVLPTLARRRAGTRGEPHPRDRTLVIGDTPRDIACARADGVRCVAVSTGSYARADLLGADGVADDASELRSQLERLLAL